MGIDLLHIDCMEYMATCKDKQFDLAIVDPPYGIGVAKMAYTREKNRPCKQNNGSKLIVRKLPYRQGDWDKLPPSDKYFDELLRISKHQIIWGENYLHQKFKGGRIIWDKLTPDGVSFSDCEIAYCSLRNGVTNVYFLWAGMMQGIYCGKNVRRALIQQGDKSKNEKRIHPTQKPVAIYKWLLDNYAKPGDKILDTHLGSGSIAIACHDYGFDLVGCEIDKDYYQAALKRYNNHISQTRLDLSA